MVHVDKEEWFVDAYHQPTDDEDNFVWKQYLREISSKHPQYESKTHKCMARTNKGLCGDLIKVQFDAKKGKKGSGARSNFKAGKAQQHWEGEKHKGHFCYNMVHRKKMKAVNDQFQDGQRGLKSCFKGSVQKYGSKSTQLIAQMQWYVFGTCMISKETFECKYYRKMMYAANSDAYICPIRALSLYIEAEFNFFLKCLRYVVASLRVRHGGNKFAQGQHDDVTLADKRKYTSMAFQAVFDYQNWVFCLGFAICEDGTGSGHAEAYQDMFLLRAGCKVQDVMRHVVSDIAGRKTAKEMDIDDAACEMHQSDKIGRSAIGSLVKSRNNVVQNGFPEGTQEGVCGVFEDFI